MGGASSQFPGQSSQLFAQQQTPIQRGKQGQSPQTQTRVKSSMETHTGGDPFHNTRRDRDVGLLVTQTATQLKTGSEVQALAVWALGPQQASMQRCRRSHRSPPPSSFPGCFRLSGLSLQSTLCQLMPPSRFHT